jgi:hypothetical protein
LAAGKGGVERQGCGWADLGGEAVDSDSVDRNRATALEKGGCQSADACNCHLLTLLCPSFRLLHQAFSEATARTIERP